MDFLIPEKLEKSSMDDRDIFKILEKKTDKELLAYFLNSNIIIQKRMKKNNI